MNRWRKCGRSCSTDAGVTRLTVSDHDDRSPRPAHRPHRSGHRRGQRDRCRRRPADGRRRRDRAGRRPRRGGGEGAGPRRRGSRARRLRPVRPRRGRRAARRGGRAGQQRRAAARRAGARVRPGAVLRDPTDHARGAVPAVPPTYCRTCTTAAGAGDQHLERARPAGEPVQVGLRHRQARPGGAVQGDRAGGRAHGVTSNCVNPAYVRTPLVEKQIADQARPARHRRGRGRREDHADARWR